MSHTRRLRRVSDDPRSLPFEVPRRTVPSGFRLMAYAVQPRAGSSPSDVAEPGGSPRCSGARGTPRGSRGWTARSLDYLQARGGDEAGHDVPPDPILPLLRLLAIVEPPGPAEPPITGEAMLPV